MCGRFSLDAEMPQLSQRFEAEAIPDWHPRYNIAPSQPCLALVEEGNARRFKMMTWGFIPRWSQERNIPLQLINARAESVQSKPMYKDPLQHHRCIIPADGFYEWEEVEQEKIPFRVTHKSGAPFALAGLWDISKNDKGEEILTFTIITVPANEILYQLHDRMPLILKREDEAVWLNPALTDIGQLIALMQPYPSEEMHFYEVSKAVNSWKNDTADCIQPIQNH